MTELTGAIPGMSQDQVLEALRAAARAPSMHNTQPWRFRVTELAFEVWVDTARRLPVADPDDRLLRLACGAAVFNLRLATLAAGRRPRVRLLPDPASPQLLATVEPGAPATDPALTELARAIPLRHTHRRPFLADRVPPGHRRQLRRAAHAEHGLLFYVDDTGQRAALRHLLHTAHRRQQTDTAFRAELAAWTGHGGERADGVPAVLGGPRPEPQDVWVLRDFTGGTARPRVPGKDFEPEPLIAVLASYTDWPLDQLRAGQALQRVLLTATAWGLSASFLSQVVEQPEERSELRGLLGDRCWPQMVLRIGYGTPTGTSPRRPLDDLLAGSE